MTIIEGYITMSAYLTKRHKATVHKDEGCLLVRWSLMVPVLKKDMEEHKMKKCKVCWK